MAFNGFLFFFAGFLNGFLMFGGCSFTFFVGFYRISGGFLVASSGFPFFLVFANVLMVFGRVFREEVLMVF